MPISGFYFLGIDHQKQTAELMFKSRRVFVNQKGVFDTWTLKLMALWLKEYLFSLYTGIPVYPKHIRYYFGGDRILLV